MDRSAATASAAPLLELRALSRRFGALRVVDQLDLQVAEGEALGVIGPNGAGKTTLMNLIAGDLTANGGQVIFGGRDLTELPAQERCRVGIARTYQVPQPFGGLSVFENVLVGAIFGAGAREKAARAQALRVLEQTGLRGKADRLAGALPLLDRKRLELARALASGPRLLLLDEIAGGLTDQEVQQLLQTIRAIHDSGVTIIWIEHIVHALVAVVGRLVALDFGRKVTEGAPQDVMNDPAVREIYMGIDVAEEAVP